MTVSHSVREGPLRLQIEGDGASLTVRASGELDTATTAALERALKHAFDGDAASIILDVVGVRFIDSSGLLTLIQATTHSRMNGDRLRIRCGSGAVRRMIDRTGLEDWLPLTA